MYRIVKVILHFIPLNNAIDIYGGNPPAVQSGGMLYTCKDYNDINNPATVSEVASYQTCKFTPSYEKHVRSIKPLLLAEDESGGNIPFQPANSTWVPITKDAQPYCGIKYGINASPDATRIKFQVIGQYLRFECIYFFLNLLFSFGVYSPLLGSCFAFCLLISPIKSPF